MPGNPLTDENWAAEVTQQITTFVGTVRDKTTNNAVKAVRAVVWGTLAGLLGLTLLVLVLVGFTRVLQVILDLLVSWPRAVYLSYLILGGMLTVAAVLMMKKRHSPN